VLRNRQPLEFADDACVERVSRRQRLKYEALDLLMHAELSWGIGQIPGLRVAALTCNNMPSPHLRAWQNLLEAPSRTKMVKHLVRITTCVCTFQLASITKSLCKDSFELYTMLQIISQ
jgi:hypothetical protein